MFIYVYIQKRECGEIYGFRDAQIGRNSFVNILDYVLKRALNIENVKVIGYDIKGKPRIRRTYTLQSWRKSLITCLAAAGLGTEQIKIFSLHSSSQVVEKYVLEHEMRAQRKSLERQVDSFIGCDEEDSDISSSVDRRNNDGISARISCSRSEGGPAFGTRSRLNGALNKIGMDKIKWRRNGGKKKEKRRCKLSRAISKSVVYRGDKALSRRKGSNLCGMESVAVCSNSYRTGVSTGSSASIMDYHGLALPSLDDGFISSIGYTYNDNETALSQLRVAINNGNDYSQYNGRENVYNGGIDLHGEVDTVFQDNFSIPSTSYQAQLAQTQCM